MATLGVTVSTTLANEKQRTPLASLYKGFALSGGVHQMTGFKLAPGAEYTFTPHEFKSPVFMLLNETFTPATRNLRAFVTTIAQGDDMGSDGGNTDTGGSTDGICPISEDLSVQTCEYTRCAALLLAADNLYSVRVINENAVVVTLDVIF